MWLLIVVFQPTRVHTLKYKQTKTDSQSFGIFYLYMNFEVESYHFPLSSPFQVTFLLLYPCSPTLKLIAPFSDYYCYINICYVYAHTYAF